MKLKHLLPFLFVPLLASCDPTGLNTPLVESDLFGEWINTAGNINTRIVIQEKRSMYTSRTVELGQPTVAVHVVDSWTALANGGPTQSLWPYGYRLKTTSEGRTGSFILYLRSDHAAIGRAAYENPGSAALDVYEKRH